MSWRERDYWNPETDERRARVLLRRQPPATVALLILHAAAFVLVLMLTANNDPSIAGALVLGARPTNALAILLHPFGTTSFLSLVFTLVTLWVLGALLEPRLGPGQLVVRYVIANLVAGAVLFGLDRALPDALSPTLDYPVGALAAWALAAWRLSRDQPVTFFGRITSLSRVIAIWVAIFVGFFLLQDGLSGLAWLAAAAVAATTALLADHLPRLRAPRRPGQARSRGPGRADRPAVPPPDTPDVDEILAKISRSGLDSLTAEERARLEAARRAMQRKRA